LTESLEIIYQHTPPRYHTALSICYFIDNHLNLGFPQHL
jgi:hypothetical protein